MYTVLLTPLTSVKPCVHGQNNSVFKKMQSYLSAYELKL